MGVGAPAPFGRTAPGRAVNTVGAPDGFRPTERLTLDADGRWTGVRGYHHGEQLRVVRRGDGSVSHLTCATFVYTRTPYDADVPIPGGHPG